MYGPMKNRGPNPQSPNPQSPFLPMNLIAFETSTPTGGAALFREGLLEGEMMIANPQSHSRVCLRYAEQLLAAAGMKWKDLDAVATSHGPGSFTGVRVGLTLAKGLAWSLRIRTTSVSTLEAIAHNGWSGEAAGHVAALVDARIGEVYGALFRVEEGTLLRATEDFCVAPEKLAERLPEGPVLFCGEGAARYFDQHWRGHGQLARPGGSRCVSWRRGKTFPPRIYVLCICAILCGGGDLRGANSSPSR